MWAVGLVIGAFVGGAYDGAVGVLGAAAGLVAGIMAGSWKKRLQQRVSDLEARVQTLLVQPAAGTVVPPPAIANVVPPGGVGAGQRSVRDARDGPATRDCDGDSSTRGGTAVGAQRWSRRGCCHGDAHGGL